MYGLIMLREYLNEILDEFKTYDARSYETKKRGTIALVDTRKSAIIGFVDLVDTHPISAREYCDWHATGKWAGLVLRVEDMSRNYWAYDFNNPIRLNTSIKVVKNGRNWIEIDDKIIRKVN